ncbi:hypothetical protein CL645_04865 [bacterium]|nr:hypothetical protein [bacterium]
MMIRKYLNLTFSSMFFAILTFLTLSYFEFPENFKKHKQQRSETVLIVGLDQSEEDINPDTILLTALPKEGGSPKILSIPRDTLVETESGTNRINHSWHENGNITGLRGALQSLANIPVDKYLVINFNNLEELIDDLGGVKVHIEKEMKYEDKSQNLLIDFSPGIHNLNGHQSLLYARFRNDALGDIGRIQRQQRLAHAILKKFHKTTTLKKIFIIKNFLKNIETNLKIEEILVLGIRTRGEAPSTEILPGKFMGPYWSPEMNELNQWVAKNINQ